MARPLMKCMKRLREADSECTMSYIFEVPSLGLKTLNGKNTRDVVFEDIELGGGFAVFVREMLTVSELDFVVQRADYEWFTAELQRSGPLLGLDVV